MPLAYAYVSPHNFTKIDGNILKDPSMVFSSENALLEWQSSHRIGVGTAPKVCIIEVKQKVKNPLSQSFPLIGEYVIKEQYDLTPLNLVKRQNRQEQDRLNKILQQLPNGQLRIERQKSPGLFRNILNNNQTVSRTKQAEIAKRDEPYRESVNGNGVIIGPHGNRYTELSHKFTKFLDSPVASLGSADREIVYANPQMLKPYYEEFNKYYSELNVASQLKLPNFSVDKEQLFYFACCYYVQSKFNLNNMEANFNDLMAEWQKKNPTEVVIDKNGKPVNFVSLASVIDAGVGVCRHVNLLVCYLYAFAVRDKLIPEGDIHHNRDEVIMNGCKGAHTWVVYHQKNNEQNLISVDVLHEIIFNVKTARDKGVKAYGERAVRHMEERYLKSKQHEEIANVSISNRR